jgi:hypothetical protein
MYTPRPNTRLREGAEVRIPSRERWGVCTVFDARDTSLLTVYVPALERYLHVGRAAVEPVGSPMPDL